MKCVRPILYACAFLLSLALCCQAQNISVKASAGSHNLVTAEVTYVTFEFRGLSNYPRPTKIKLKDADLFYSHASADRRAGKNIYYLHYEYQAVRAGEYEIPQVTFASDKGDIISDKFTINVYPKEDLAKKTADIQGQKLTYYTLTKAAKSSLFPNETTQVEHKIYLPEQLRVALWGLPLGKKKNCSAWRFKTPTYRTSISRARINGKTYQAGSFQTNLTSLKEGAASIGPLKSRVVFHTTVMTSFGIVNKQFETQIISEKLDLTVKPLPPQQPERFRGDVGNYILTAMIDSPDSISESDSIQIVAQLKGTGNLATVNPPLLLDLDGWKVISQNRTDLGDDRKSAKGIAEFTYLLQPDTSEKLTTQTPSLLCIVLDPETGEYRRSRIPSKPISIIPSASATAESSTEKPYKSLIASPDLSAFELPWYRSLPIWLIHLLPLSFILFIISRLLRRRLQAKRIANEERNLKKQALVELEKVDSLFLKSAGAYIERWIDTDKHPRAKEILSLRDSLCFRPDGKQDVSKERRKKIIAALRKCSLVVFFTFFLQNSHGKEHQKQDDILQANGVSQFEKNDYNAAIATFSSLVNSANNPDILYNIGLCHQLNNAPGLAAYNYHLALQKDSSHTSALKNLNYVETQNSSITSSKPTDLERWIQTLTPSSYLHITFFLFSIILCLILTFIYLKPRGAAFRLTIILCIFTPLILALSIYGYVSHPDKSTYLLKPAVILENTTLTSQPLTSSQAVMDAPPASQCHVIAQRGSYTYILMANGVKGWIASDLVKTY